MSDRCGCCEGTEILTPQETANRPGLDALHYRIGTHATFLATLLARLSSSAYPELRALTSRASDDAAIALLDAWATVADVLTFYQERIANEGYLRTATERRSILELARLVGYALRPGVAASVYLAYTVEAGYSVTIPAGARAQSIPAPGETAQSFETSEQLLARGDWNDLKPRLTRPQYINPVNGRTRDTLYFAGFNTNLKPNDPLLLVFGSGRGNQVARRVERVEAQNTENRSKVTLQPRPEYRQSALLISAVRETIARYMRLEDFQVAPEREMTGRVTDLTQRLLSQLTPDQPLEELLASISATTAELETEHAIALEGAYSRLRPWVGGLRDDLNQTVLRSGGGTATATPSSTAKVAALSQSVVRSPLDRLYTLLPGLSKPPSEQPANAQRLSRDTQAIFSEQSDLSPKLLANFNPALRPQLYSAWGSSEVSASLELESVQALRTKAAPFGSNAPLKPIYDDEGRVTGYEEWPLGEIVTTTVQSVRATPSVSSGTPTVESVSSVPSSNRVDLADLGRLRISLKQGNNTLSQIIALINQRGALIPTQRIMLGTQPVTITVRLQPQLRFLEFIQEDLPGQGVIYIDGERVAELTGNEVLRYIAVTPGEHVVELRVEIVESPSETRLRETIRVEAGRAYSLALLDDRILVMDDPLDPLPANQARVRVLNGTGEDLRNIQIDTTNVANELGRLEFSDYRNIEAGGRMLFAATASGLPLSWQLGLEANRSYDLFVQQSGTALFIREANQSLSTRTLDFRDVELIFDFEQIRTLSAQVVVPDDEEPAVLLRIIQGQTEILRQLFAVGQTSRQTTRGHTVTVDLRDQLLIVDEAAAPLSAAQRREFVLDAPADQIVPGSWVLIERPDPVREISALVLRVEPVAMAAYGISAKTTRLILDQPWLFDEDTTLAPLRRTTIYAQSEPLELALEPIDPVNEPVAGKEIELGRLYDGLEAGRWLIVSGERSDIPDTPGVRGSELVMLAAVRQGVSQVRDPKNRLINLPGDTTHTTLVLAEGLAYSYKRDTVTIYGNVAPATHGETRQEILGSGDGSKALQQFTLRQAPLTYTAATTPSGVASSLAVYVNNIRWHETSSLAGLGPSDRNFVTRSDDANKTTIVFGNGYRGARLPSGVENVRATYRFGIGKPGNLAAGQISQLMTRPLGLKEVVNPLPATGGADPESRDQARRNTPLAVLALDRLVSLQDYADFARTFAGIGKASAAQLSDGRRELVHVTIAGADDIPIATTSELYRNLRAALRQFGDIALPLQLEVRELLVLVIQARVQVLPDYQWESVEPRIRAVLLDTFSFTRRELGQDVWLSEVISAIQHVPGVDYVDVDLLETVAESDTEDANRLKQRLEEISKAAASKQPRQHIPVALGHIDRQGIIRKAQLAFLNPALPDTLLLSAIS